MSEQDQNPFSAPSNAEPPASVDGWYVVSKLNADNVADKLGEFFATEKYRLESGDKMNGKYGIGNSVLRICFGAFVKRFRFDVTVAAHDAGSIIRIEKGMTGISGGAIGYAKLGKELNRIRNEVAMLMQSAR